MSTRGRQFSKRRGAPCAECGNIMRAAKDRIADYPGTVLHACHGLCKRCYTDQVALNSSPEDAHPAPLVIQGLDSDDPEIRSLARAAQDWLDRRRRRHGVPVEGIAA